MSARVWTTGKKWLGNLLPLLCTIPALGMATWHYRQTNNPFDIVAIGWMLAAIPCAIVGLNYFGMMGNRAMQRAMERKLANVGLDIKLPRFFVGAATPSHQSLLDAHEDVGFVVLEPEQLRFLGESLNIQIAKSAIQSVRYRPNIHSLLGLGGWIEVAGILNGKPIRLYLEPRSQPSMLGCRKDRPRLMAMLQKWKTGP